VKSAVYAAPAEVGRLGFLRKSGPSTIGRAFHGLFRDHLLKMEKRESFLATLYGLFPYLYIL